MLIDPTSARLLELRVRVVDPAFKLKYDGNAGVKETTLAPQPPGVE